MKYRIMKNGKGIYRVRIKRFYGWAWVLYPMGPSGHKPQTFEAGSFMAAEDYVTELMEAQSWVDKANDWQIISELEG